MSEIRLHISDAMDLPLSEICIEISDMTDMASDLKASLVQRIDARAPKAVWTPADFLDLGSRDAVDKTLQRLVAIGDLRRIDRGLYDKPGRNSLTQQSSPPDPREIIDAIARRDQIRVLVDGMTAANDLGLTNAIPAKIVVHTDARLKTIHLGHLTISFRLTAASKLFWAGRPAMRIVQALHWVRDTMGGDPQDDAMVHRRLMTLLHDPRHGKILRDDLADGLSTVPAWMQAYLKPMLASQASAA
jgi:hypothetical protein